MVTWPVGFTWKRAGLPCWKGAIIRVFESGWLSFDQPVFILLRR